MYHHIENDSFSNSLDTFREHLEYLTKNYHIVTPDDRLSTTKTNLSITFDDAYYDFYHFVYPLLKEYGIKATLAVPTGLISDTCSASTKERLSLNHKEIYRDRNYQKFGSFCTWGELKEMSDSSLVVMASHSHRHKDLSSSGIDLHQEIILSKEILKSKLDRDIDSFILPFGRYHKESLTLLQQHYRYIFRVGQGINRDFSGVNGLIYRIDADGVDDISSLLNSKNMVKYTLKSVIKSFYDGIQK
jgi:peptidoglycan/xylan/chitin deacetylase (PgdA/CDA1 family)